MLHRNFFSLLKIHKNNISRVKILCEILYEIVIETNTTISYEIVKRISDIYEIYMRSHMRSHLQFSLV